jgi:SAM-dependent methyltransferase
VLPMTLRANFSSVIISSSPVATVMQTSGVFLVAALLSASLALAQKAGPSHEPDVPYIPTTETAVRAMLELAGVKRSDIVYDLGCGDGRIVIAAAKRYGARGVGIDIDPALVREAKKNARQAGVERRVEFREQDLFQSNFREATVVTLFLLPAINKRLLPQLEALKPGTRIVSNTFAIGDWKPVREIVVKDDPDDDYYFGSHRLFLWIVPKRK